MEVFVITIVFIMFVILVLIFSFQFIKNKNNMIEKLTNDKKNLEEKFNNLNLEVVRKQERINSLTENIKQKENELKNLTESLKLEFENITNKIIKTEKEELAKISESKFNEILTPFNNQIIEFKKRIETIHESEIKENTNLKNMITDLNKSNQKITEEANNLVNALRGDNKKLGNWGELQLEKIFEISTIDKSIYKMQKIFKNSEGNKKIPDCVIELPDSKKIIIDSKISLKAYTDYINSEESTEKQRFLKDHINSIKNHINNLSKDEYQNLPDVNTLEFVFLFFPVEQALNLALQKDETLFSFAIGKNIVLSSPTTLLVCLKVVANMWKQENQKKNIKEIFEKAGQIHDRICDFVNCLNEIKSGIEKSDKAHLKAINILTEGAKGSTVKDKILKLKELGDKTTKNLQELS